MGELRLLLCVSLLAFPPSSLLSVELASPLLLCFFSRTVSDLWKQHAAVEVLFEQMAVQEWRRNDIDVLLCPCIGPAFNFLYCGRLTVAASMTMIYNLLNFPAGVVPVSMVTAEDEEELRQYEGNFQDGFDKLYKKAVSGGQGLPVAVQCVALPWQDELCLRFMREVETLVRQKKK
ncbi:unnamed protein product, partial [Tetraodon nigroviridis]